MGWSEKFSSKVGLETRDAGSITGELFCVCKKLKSVLGSSIRITIPHVWGGWFQVRCVELVSDCASANEKINYSFLETDIA